MKAELQKLIDIALDKNMYPEILKGLYSSLKESPEENLKLKISLSRNLNCPIDIITKLSKDENDEIRLNISTHRLTTAKILESFIKDSNVNVKLAAIKNTNISEDSLMSFMKDENPEVVKYSRLALKQRL